MDYCCVFSLTSWALKEPLLTAIYRNSGIACSLCVIFISFRILQSELNGSWTFLNCSDKNDPVTVCYYTDWSPHRAGKAHFEPKDIDHELCTHITYVFSLLNETTMDGIEPEEPEFDIGLGLFFLISEYRALAFATVIIDCMV